MNHLHCIVAGLIVAWGLALGGTARAEDLPADVYKAANAEAPATRNRIDQFIKRHVANLSSDKATAAQLGRDSLAQAVSHTDATPAFLTTYASIANQQLAALADNPKMSVRLNAAIAADRIASRTNNDRLADAALRFMDDNTDPVALWGVKTARYILPYTIGRAGDRVGPALIEAAKNHPDYGPLVEEAYDSLTLGFPNITADDAALGPAAQRVLELLDYRVRQYQTSLPPSPAADAKGATFLVFTRVWQKLRPQDQQRTVQLLSDLLGLSGQHVAAMAAAGGAIDADVLHVLQQAGDAVAVIGSFTRSAPITDAGRKLTVAGGLTDRLPAADLTQRANDAVTAIHTQFPAVKAPPKFDPNAPPPGAATQPGAAPATRPAAPAAPRTAPAAPPPPARR